MTPMNRDEFASSWKKFIDNDERQIIEINGSIIGMVSYYWESEVTKWLELGIVIYDASY